MRSRAKVPVALVLQSCCCFGISMFVFEVTSFLRPRSSRQYAPIGKGQVWQEAIASRASTHTAAAYGGTESCGSLVIVPVRTSACTGTPSHFLQRIGKCVFSKINIIVVVIITIILPASLHNAT